MSANTHCIRVSDKAYKYLRRGAYKTRKSMIEIVDEIMNQQIAKKTN